MNELKLIRVKIYTLITMLRSRYISPNEISLAVTSLRRARMFLGKVLEELSPDTNPYPESTNPESSRIEPRADAEQYDYAPVDIPLTDVGEIKLLRRRIQDIIEDMKRVAAGYHPDRDLGGVFYTTALLALIEAKMWLGEELVNMRDRSLSSISVSSAPMFPIDQCAPLPKEQIDWMNVSNEKKDE